MGILGKVLFFPITGPVAGIRWSLNKVIQVAEEEFDGGGGKKFRRGTFVVQGVERGALEKAISTLEKWKF